jgi:hypothetical protein
MGWLLRNNWPWSLLAFLLGAVITWFLLVRREPPAQAVAQPVEEKEEVLVGAAVSRTAEHPPAAAVEVHAVPPAAHVVPEEPRPTFSRRMEAERVETPTLFDDAPDEGLDEAPAGTGGPSDTEPQVRADVPPGRYGEGSADAVPHQGPPDGFTIKGNAQSMLFHTPDSPYYGRTKPQVWFRTEADAERAGFTKYTRRPRKSANPREQ